MTTKTIQESTKPKRKAQSELYALKLTLEHAEQNFELSPRSISSSVITAEPIQNFDVQEGATGELTFRLQDNIWSCPASVSHKGKAEIELSLSTGNRPDPDSRVSKRWKNSKLHPITAKIRNDLSAGQWLHCAVDDISIGGARLIVTNDCEFFKGQRAKIEIAFPLQPTSSLQDCEITSVMSENDELQLHVRFSPITNEHIQSIAKHLIEFEWEHTLSDLELDLSHTHWPAHRIKLSITSGERTIEVSGSILGETLCRLKASIHNGTAIIESPSFDSRWDKKRQLASLLPTLVDKLSKSHGVEKIATRGLEDWPTDLATGERTVEEWLQELSFDKEKIDLSEKSNKSSGVLASAKNALKLSDSKPDSISWDDYGLVYDKMCTVNSSYQALTQRYSKWLTKDKLRVTKAIDVGAGTGNFVLKTAEAFPNAEIVHVDQDIIMNLFAQEKYKAQKANNIKILTSSIELASFEESSFDLITAVHSLYTLEDPHGVIKRIYHWLNHGGYFYVIDIGRTIDTNEWSKHIFFDTAKTRGLIHTAKYFWDARAAISQNKKIQAAQDSGGYWTKEHDEFRSVLESVGFEIEESDVTYRGNSDLFVCRKP